MKKKLILLTFASIALSSCGGNSGNAEQEKDKEGNTIVKILFHVNSNTAEGQAYAARLKAFNDAYRNEGIRASGTFKARNSGAGDYDVYLANLQRQGKLHDIITFDAPLCANYADTRLLWDISGEIDEEERNDFITLNRFNGKVYGLPIMESSAGFYYNKVLFRQAGINVDAYTVDNPWTFDQFKDVCRALLNAGITPVDMRYSMTTDETAPYLLYPFIYAAGGDFVSSDGKKATGYFDKQETKNGFQFLKDILTEGYTKNTLKDSDFFAGNVGMLLSSGWTIPQLRRDFTETVPEWGLLPYPQSVTKASANGSWCYGVTNNGVKDKSATMKLLKWMASSESTTEVTKATGMIPSRKSAIPAYDNGSPEKLLYEQLEKTGKARPATVGYSKFSEIFNDIIYQLKEGNVNDIVNNATSTFQRYLNNL